MPNFETAKLLVNLKHFITGRKRSLRGYYLKAQTMVNSWSLEPNESSKRWETKSFVSLAHLGWGTNSLFYFIGNGLLSWTKRQEVMLDVIHGLLVLNKSLSLSQASYCFINQTKCTPRAKAKEDLKTTTWESGCSICWCGRTHYGLAWGNACLRRLREKYLDRVNSNYSARETCGNRHV